MSNKTKIALAIIIILIIILGIYAITKGNKKDNIMENKENVFDMNSYLDEMDNSAKEGQLNESNEIENNVIENNEIKNQNTINSDKTIQKNESDSKNQIIGKEEQESNNKAEIDLEEKAKQLAKKEWGIDVNSYDYNIIKKIDNNNYQVEVRSKTTTAQIVIYNVNVVTEQVTEQ